MPREKGKALRLMQVHLYSNKTNASETMLSLRFKAVPIKEYRGDHIADETLDSPCVIVRLQNG